MSPVELVADLVAATASAHSPRALARAVAQTLATRWPITCVELGGQLVELSNGEWRPVDVTTGPAPRPIVPGLAVTLRGKLPHGHGTPEVRVAIGQVLEAATRHLEVVQRVALVSRRAHAESRELRADLDRVGPAREVIARSPAMYAAWTRAQLVARHPTTVLLTGESGSGKEVLAREIHRMSGRAHRPLVQLNCGAIAEGLVDSELFGHERGSFTGAERVHAGAFERAHRGTLLLDEVAELPPAAQVKLLRVLQERRIRRVGGEHDIEVDVRLIAATHRSLSVLVDAGAFRDDLRYRLDVFSIRVPPLRERAGDLAPLATSLVAELARKLGVAPPPLTRATLARLGAYDWPGNVRELANVLESALVLGGGSTLELPADLPRRASPARGGTLDDAIRVAIEDALRAARGKIYGRDGAAERLGLEPSTLQSKMRKLRIDRARFTT